MKRQIMHSTVERTEIWMYEHPKATAIILAWILVSAGIITGLAAATNIYDTGVRQMFEKGSESHRPVEYNGKLYSIQNFYVQDDELNGFQWICGDGDFPSDQNECVAIPYGTNQTIVDAVSKAVRDAHP